MKRVRTFLSELWFAVGIAIWAYDRIVLWRHDRWRKRAERIRRDN